MVNYSLSQLVRVFLLKIRGMFLLPPRKEERMHAVLVSLVSSKQERLKVGNQRLTHQCHSWWPNVVEILTKAVRLTQPPLDNLNQLSRHNPSKNINTEFVFISESVDC